MAPTTRNAAATMQLPTVISDNSTDTEFFWDGSPLTKHVWLQFLQNVLEEDKSIQSLFERGWVLSQGKVAVESAMHARYLISFPDIFFDWTSPAPPFSAKEYEERRIELMRILDAWHSTRNADESPPFTLSFYDPSKPSDIPPSFDAIIKAEKEESKKLPALNDSEKLRFTISPEVLSSADSAASVIIAKTITDKDF